MRKKLATLITSLFLVLGTAWAQISTLGDLDNSKAYLLKNANDMGYAIWKSGNNLTLCGASSKYTDALDVTAGGSNWQIIKYENAYYLYNVGAERFAVTQRGATYLTETPTAINIASVSKGFAFNSLEASDTYMCAAHHLNPPVQWWYSSDNGSAWQIIENTETASLQDFLVGATKVEEYFSTQVKLTIQYMFTGTNEILYTTEVMATKGEQYTVETPYFTSIASVTIPGIIGGKTFTVPNTATEITVALNNEFPYETTTIVNGEFPADAAWYVIKQNSTQGDTRSWKYVNSLSTEAVTEYTDNHLWCFVGNPFDLKIYSKVAGASMSLSSSTQPASMMKDATGWVVVKSDKEQTFAGQNPFCLQRKDVSGSYLNGYSFGYYGERDGGSTIKGDRAYSLTVKYTCGNEDLTAHNVNKVVIAGSNYSIEPLAGYNIVSCTANGNAVDNVDGAYAVTVNAATEVEVTLESTAEPTDLYALKSPTGTYFNFTAPSDGTESAASFRDTPTFFYKKVSGTGYTFEDLSTPGRFIGLNGGWNVGTTSAVWNISAEDADGYVTISRNSGSGNLGHDTKWSAGTGIFTNVGANCNKWQLIPAYPVTVIYECNGKEVSRVKTAVFAGTNYVIENKGKEILECKADKGKIVEANGTYSIENVNAAIVVNVALLPPFEPEDDKAYVLKEKTSGLYLDIRTLGIKDGTRNTNNISLSTKPYPIYFEEGTIEEYWKMKNANGKYVFHNPINAGDNGHWNPEIGDKSSDWIVAVSKKGLTIARAADGKYLNVDSKEAGKPLYCDKGTAMHFELLDYDDVDFVVGTGTRNGDNGVGGTGTIQIKEINEQGLTTIPAGAGWRLKMEVENPDGVSYNKWGSSLLAVGDNAFPEKEGYKGFQLYLQSATNDDGNNLDAVYGGGDHIINNVSHTGDFSLVVEYDGSNKITITTINAQGTEATTELTGSLPEITQFAYGLPTGINIKRLSIEKIDPEYTFSIGESPENVNIVVKYNNEDVPATFAESTLNVDLFTATEVTGYTWKIVVDKENLTLTLIYTKAAKPEENPEAVVALVNRIGGAGTADKFKFVLDPSINSKQETFILGDEDGKILIKGTTISAITTGLGWYLNNIAHINIAWNSLNEKTVSGAAYADLSNLPLPAETETHTSDAKYRYYLNYCTFGYSMTSWTWKRWQQEIDWMALHGINMPLQIIGLEEVWRKFLTEYCGYTNNDAKAFVAGPAFTAWWGMNNLEGWGGTGTDGWGGVQDDAWYARQANLAKNIGDRQRELGMQPVLPGFSGMVPTNFTEKTTIPTDQNGNNWGGFHRPHIIDPDYADFANVAANYYKCLAEVMGTSQYYSMDPFHEDGVLSSNGTEARYAKGYRNIYDAMEVAMPGSQWVIQQWQWKWYQKVSITAVPAGRLIALDLFSDGKPAFDSYNGYAPQDAVFCAIPNFGGRSGLMGRLQNVTDNYFKFKGQYASIKGIGTAPEAIEQTPVTYDLIYQLPWMNGVKPDVAKWVENYAVARYGKDNAVVKEAWSLLRQGPLGYGADAIQGPVEDVWAARPNLDANPASSWGTTLNSAGNTYTKEKRQKLIDAVYKLIDQREELNPTPGSIYESNYLYDIVEFGGAVMADYAYDLLLGIKAAKDAAGANFATDATYIARRDAFLQLILDMDAFRGTNLNFRLGKWTQEARDAAAEAETYGATIADEDWYEFNNARTILTTWGDQGQNGNGAWNNGLKDYSYRSWQGLLADYYYPRWKYYFDNGCTHPNGNAKNYFYFEWNWAHGMTHQVGDTEKSTTRLAEGAKGYSYSRTPEGNTVEKAVEMLGKYIIPIKYNDGTTYYAYRTFEHDLTDKITVNVADGSTANLTYYFDVPEDAIVTGDFVNNESKSAVVTEVPVKYVEGDCTASITLTDGTVLSFKVHTPLFYGVYILNHNYPSDTGGTLTSPVYVRYHDAADAYGNVGYKMVGTGGTENDRLFTIVPSDKGEGYMLSAQGKFVKSLQDWQHIMFSDDKEEAGAYVFEEAEGVFKLKGENGWYAQGWGGDIVFAGQDAGISSTFTVEKQTTYPITLSKEGYATICLPFNVILPAGVYAYDICSDMLDSENEDGVLSRIAAPGDILLAGTPAVLEGGAEENILLGVTMNSVGGKTKLPNSVLHGSYTRQTLQPGGDTKKFILDGTVFKAITESKEIPANHCWVEANIEDDEIDLELVYVQIGDWKFKAIHTGKGITLTECVNYSEGHLVIGPKYVVAGVEKKVIAVADNFLHDCEHLTEVTFPYTLTSVGKSYSNFMFELQYEGPDQGFGENVGYENPYAAEAWVGQSHDCHYKVLGASNWRMTVEVTVDQSELQHFNDYGSCLVATRENTLSNNYNDGSMQLYLRQDKGIVLKLDQTGDRYMFNNPANYANLPNGTQYVGDASTFTFTYILENDGAGGYFAKIVYGDGTEEVFELTAADKAELHDFNTVWSSLGKGIDVKVTLEKITNKGLFVGCTNLRAIHVDPLSRSFFGCDHGVLYNKSQTHIIRFPEGGGEIIEDCGYTETGHRHFETPRTVTMVYAGALHDVNAHIIFHSNPIILTVEDETDPGHAQEHMLAKYHLVLDDDSEVIDFNSANRNTFETIHYWRKVTIGEGKDFEYGTIMLPFVPDAKWLANYEFYELKGWEDNSIYFSQVKQLQANVPYLYKITDGDVVMITENRKTIEPVMHYTSEVEHESGEWKSVGTYSTKSIVTNSEGEKSSYYAINSKYEFVRATKTLKTKPYRAYYLFTNPDATAPAKLTLRMTDGTTTEIDASQVEGLVAPEYYDLMGRRVLNPENGIYIVNGRKVLVK